MPRSSTPSKPLEPKLEARLQRQTKRMGDAFGRAHKAQTDPVRDAEGKFYFAELEDVVSRARNRCAAYVVAGPSLAVGALRHPRGRALSARLTRPPCSPQRAFSDVATWVAPIAPATLTDNSLLLGKVSVGDDELIVTADALPITCWPLPDDALRALVFGNVLLLTMYNPAHLWAALRERGFALTMGDRATVRQAVRVEPDQHLHLENADYFHGLIQRSFMSLESVLCLVDQLVGLTEEKAAEGFRKIQMRPVVTRGPISLEG